MSSDRTGTPGTLAKWRRIVTTIDEEASCCSLEGARDDGLSMHRGSRIEVGGPLTPGLNRSNDISPRRHPLLVLIAVTGRRKKVSWATRCASFQVPGIASFMEAQCSASGRSEETEAEWRLREDELC